MPNIGGFLQLASCVSWDQNAATVCNDPSQALPGTSSKCRCDLETPTDLPVPNLALTCGCVPNPVDPGATATCTVTYTNDVPALVGDPCTADASVAERFRCATASFLRYKIDFDDVNGTVSNISSSRGSQVLSDTDAMNGDDRITWTPASLLSSAGIIASNETDTLTFDYTVDGGSLDTIVTIDTTSWWNNDLTFASEVEQTTLRRCGQTCSVSESEVFFVRSRHKTVWILVISRSFVTLSWRKRTALGAV